ncbi:hypothetical protein LCGC14_1756810 [marine sediment metagenome]|uniref:Uncharacterized protein n=1 Tax=marine sediment metagenome TaxID=412755 RepID=A0A0F9K1U1_9ZZZZ
MGIAIFIILYILIGVIITGIILSDESRHIYDLPDRMLFGIAGSAMILIWPIISFALLVSFLFIWIGNRINDN